MKRGIGGLLTVLGWVIAVMSVASGVYGIATRDTYYGGQPFLARIFAILISVLLGVGLIVWGKRLRAAPSDAEGLDDLPPPPD